MKTSHIFEFIIICCSLKFIPVFGNSNEFLYKWNIISSNYANDIQQSNNIYEKIKEEQHDLAKLRLLVERHLVNSNAAVLISALHSYNSSTKATSLQKILKAFKESYGNQLINNIFSEAVGEIILTNPISNVPNIIWNIYHQNDSRSYEIMLRAQIQLYKSFRLEQHTDQNEFFIQLAKKLYTVQRQPLYKKVDFNVQLKVQNIIKQLPDNLKYLYFMPYFCLQNMNESKYMEMHLGSNDKYYARIGSNRNYTIDTNFIKAEVSEENMVDEMKVYVALKGVKYQKYYYYMEASVQIHWVWDSSYVPKNYFWEVEFLDNDRVVLWQNGYLLCSQYSGSSSYQNIHGLKKGEFSSLSSECQWRLGQCISK